MSLECRRYLTDPSRISRIITTPSSFPSPALIFAAGRTRSAVQGKAMKGDHVVGIGVPRQEFVGRPFRRNVRQRLETGIFGKPAGAAPRHQSRLEPPTPAVRSPDVFDVGRAWHGFERQPQRDELFTVNRVVRLVVVPC